MTTDISEKSLRDLARRWAPGTAIGLTEKLMVLKWAVINTGYLLMIEDDNGLKFAFTSDDSIKRNPLMLLPFRTFWIVQNPTNILNEPIWEPIAFFAEDCDGNGIYFVAQLVDGKFVWRQIR